MRWVFESGFELNTTEEMSYIKNSEFIYFYSTQKICLGLENMLSTENMFFLKGFRVKQK